MTDKPLKITPPEPSERAITIVIRHVECPLCHSEQVRSKVAGNDGIWWYICDNWDDPHEIVINGESHYLRDIAMKGTGRMFFFEPDTGAIELPTKFDNRVVYVDRQEEVDWDDN